MKRHTQAAGIRYWGGDDLVELQNEPLRILDNFFEYFGNVIINGCITGTNGSISPGIVGLFGYDAEYNAVYKVVPFAGRSSGTFPAYLSLKCEVIERLYGDNQSKPVIYNYSAELTSTIPNGKPYIVITENGGNYLLDVIQSAGYRFLSDSQVNKLNGIEANANKYIHPSFTARSTGLYKITVNNQGHITGVATPTKADIGLSNVDNTADANKNVRHALVADQVVKIYPEQISDMLGYTPANPANFLPLNGGTLKGNLKIYTDYYIILDYGTMICYSNTRSPFALKLPPSNGTLFFGITPNINMAVYGLVTEYGEANNTPNDFKHRFNGTIEINGGFITHRNTGKPVFKMLMADNTYFNITGSGNTTVNYIFENTTGSVYASNLHAHRFAGSLVLYNGTLRNEEMRSSIATYLGSANYYYGIMPISTTEVRYGRVNMYGQLASTASTFIHNFIGAINADKIISRASNLSTSKVILCTDGGVMPIATDETGNANSFFNKVPYINGTGNLNIAGNIDFHNTTNTVDYTVRLSGGTIGQLTCFFSGTTYTLRLLHNAINARGSTNALNTLYFQDAKFTMDTNGNFRATGTVSGSNISDRRFKRNIKPITNATEILALLKPVSFQWNERLKSYDEQRDTEKNNFGFIAQDVEKILPELVGTIYDKYKSLDYSQITPILVSAVVEQQETIAKQEKEITDLRERLERLEKLLLS